MEIDGNEDEEMGEEAEEDQEEDVMEAQMEAEIAEAERQEAEEKADGTTAESVSAVDPLGLNTDNAISISSQNTESDKKKKDEPAKVEKRPIMTAA